MLEENQNQTIKENEILTEEVSKNTTSLTLPSQESAASLEETPAAPTPTGTTVSESELEPEKSRTSSALEPTIPKETIVPSEPSPAPVSPTPVPQPAPPVSAPESIVNENIIKNLLTKARAKIQAQRQVRLEKILEVLQQKGRLTNKDIRKLIRKSR